LPLLILSVFFFLSATSTTETYTLSLHDALPICASSARGSSGSSWSTCSGRAAPQPARLRSSSTLRRWMTSMMVEAFLKRSARSRSEEHTSELQSRENLVCRLLLEKKKKTDQT